MKRYPTRERGKDEQEHSPEQKPERLQKIMATAGLGSRRALEQRIKNGDVRINDAVAGIGQAAKPGDRITLDGVEISNPLNQETITVRALTPGEYVVNLLHYQANYTVPLCRVLITREHCRIYQLFALNYYIQIFAFSNLLKSLAILGRD